MPQSTLMGWLSRPACGPAPASDSGSRDANADKHSQKAPPATSSDDTRSAEANNPSPTIASPSLAASNGSHTLPPNVEIRACTKDDITPLKRLTGLLLPIPYPETFYRDIIDDPVTNSITLAAIWHDNPSNNCKDRGVLVGAIRCRLLAYAPATNPTPELKKDGPMLYLSTLVLLSPYRSHGIATHMLNLLTKRAARDYAITSVGAHVWEANVDGLEWYRKRGFREMKREEKYYPRLKPTTAVVMQRRVGVMDVVGG